MPARDSITKEFLAERDARIFQMKKTGLSNSEIAKRMNMTSTAVAAATKRQLKKLNSDSWLDYPEVLRLELERLDELQKSLWPLTQFRREELDDGSVVMIEPDKDAVAKVLAIMDRRQKLLGMNIERSEVSIVGMGREVVDVRSSLAGALPAGASDHDDSQAETMQLLELMGETGVLDQEAIASIMGVVGRDTIIEGEVIEEGDSDVN